MEALKALFISGPAGAAVAGINLMLEVKFVPAQKLLETVKPGDLIEFNRGTYMHWAMYSDEKGMIINIPAESKYEKQVTIKKESLLKVAGDSLVRVNNQERIAKKLGYKRRTPKDAVAAAKADIGKTLPYDFFGTNCEYYSTKWLYGKGFSIQVDHAKAGLIGTGVAAQTHGLIGAAIGTIFGGPLGAALGYITFSGAVGGFMSVCLEAAGTTHYLG